MEEVKTLPFKNCFFCSKNAYPPLDSEMKSDFKTIHFECKKIQRMREDFARKRAKFLKAQRCSEKYNRVDKELLNPKSAPRRRFENKTEDRTQDRTQEIAGLKKHANPVKNERKQFRNDTKSPKSPEIPHKPAQNPENNEKTPNCSTATRSNPKTSEQKPKKSKNSHQTSSNPQNKPVLDTLGELSRRINILERRIAEMQVKMNVFSQKMLTNSNTAIEKSIQGCAKMDELLLSFSEITSWSRLEVVSRRTGEAGGPEKASSVPEVPKEESEKGSTHGGKAANNSSGGEFCFEKSKISAKKFNADSMPQKSSTKRKNYPIAKGNISDDFSDEKMRRKSLGRPENGENKMCDTKKCDTKKSPARAKKTLPEPPRLRRKKTRNVC